MDEKSDRKELARRLEQAKRMVAMPADPVTNERLRKLVQELEEQLRESEIGLSNLRRDDGNTRSSCYRDGNG
jgi:CHASE2 domain-containing sensor protein